MIATVCGILKKPSVTTKSEFAFVYRLGEGRMSPDKAQQLIEDCLERINGTVDRGYLHDLNG